MTPSLVWFLATCAMTGLFCIMRGGYEWERDRRIVAECEVRRLRRALRTSRIAARADLTSWPDAADAWERMREGVEES